jgi:hypothetical protein
MHDTRRTRCTIGCRTPPSARRRRSATDEAPCCSATCSLNVNKARLTPCWTAIVSTSSSAGRRPSTTGIARSTCHGTAVVHWVQQALDYMQQNDRRMTSAEWLKLNRPSPTSTSTPSPSAVQLNVPTPKCSTHLQQEHDKPTQPTLCSDLDTSFKRATQKEAAVDRGRRRAWVKQLRTQLLYDFDRGQGQDPSSSRGFAGTSAAGWRRRKRFLRRGDCQRVGRRLIGRLISRRETDNSEETEHSHDNDDSAQLPHANECAVYESDPKRRSSRCGTSAAVMASAATACWLASRNVKGDAYTVGPRPCR